VYIIYDQYRCFYHNVELWYIWLYRSGITNINIVTTTKDIQKDYLCIIIAHLFSECPSNKYIAIQTEDLVQKKYIVEKLCMNACAIWDYSKSNIEFLKNNYNIHTGVHVPITYSDNTKLYNSIIFNNNFRCRKIDVIIPMHNQRRINIKNKLERIGLVCVNVWRNKLPKYANRCKLFLNVHRDSAEASLEIHRLMDVRNVPIVVVSEESLDLELQSKLDSIDFVKYDKICQTCFEICRNKDLWNKKINEQLQMWKKFDNDTIHNALQSSLQY